MSIGTTPIMNGLSLPTLGQWLLADAVVDGFKYGRHALNEWCLDKAGDFETPATLVDEVPNGTKGTAWLVGPHPIELSYRPLHFQGPDVTFRLCCPVPETDGPG